MKINANVEYVSPHKAQQYLRQNTNNRNLNRDHVNFLKKEMIEKRWELNGEPIQFNGTSLLNGQHRLQAIVESGETVPLLIVRGVSTTAVSTIDTGRARTPADALQMNGEKNATRLGAALKLLIMLENGTKTTKGKRISHGELLELLQKHPGLKRSAGRYTNGRRILQPSVITVLHYLFAQKDMAAADDFFDKLLNGTSLAPLDPILTLRNKLIENSLKSQKYDRDSLLVYTIMAWNGWRRGDKMAYIRKPAHPGFPPII